mmetsp:Transcript_99357/g.318826  ORF Transcript_99357/g.318826 Transcript_99357/m.318826 type:complete len:289 (-) Transcript_99357:312-1178(-)
MPSVVITAVMEASYRACRSPAEQHLGDSDLQLLDKRFATLDERVPEEGLCRHALDMVVVQAVPEQVDTTLAEGVACLAANLLEVRIAPLRKPGFPIAQCGDAGPDLVVGGAKHLEDLKDGVDLRVAGEERLARGHLLDDAAERPDVRGRAIADLAEQDLGRPVPESDHLVGVDLQGYAEGAGQAEVGQNKAPRALGPLPRDDLHEDVLRLQVAVDDTARMAVLQAAYELKCRSSKGPIGERAILLQTLPQVHVKALEDQVQIGFAGEDIVQLQDVGMALHVPKHRDLT